MLIKVGLECSLLVEGVWWCAVGEAVRVLLGLLGEGGRVTSVGM